VTTDHRQPRPARGRSHGEDSAVILGSSALVRLVEEDIAGSIPGHADRHPLCGRPRAAALGRACGQADALEKRFRPLVGLVRSHPRPWTRAIRHVRRTVRCGNRLKLLKTMPRHQEAGFRQWSGPRRTCRRRLHCRDPIRPPFGSGDRSRSVACAKEKRRFGQRLPRARPRRQGTTTPRPTCCRLRRDSGRARLPPDRHARHSRSWTPTAEGTSLKAERGAPEHSERILNRKVDMWVTRPLGESFLRPISQRRSAAMMPPCAVAITRSPAPPPRPRNPRVARGASASGAAGPTTQGIQQRRRF